MRDRREILQSMVLSAIADDFEEIEMILHDVAGWATEKALTVSRQEIVEALEQLISSGFAKAYLLSPTLPSKVATYSRENIDDFYFYVTPEGRASPLF